MSNNNLAPVSASCSCCCHRGGVMHCESVQACCEHAHAPATKLVEFRPTAVARETVGHRTVGGKGAVGRIK